VCVCAGAGVQIRLKCVQECVFVYLRVYVCMCTHTPRQSDRYDFYLQLLAYLGRHVCILAYVCFAVTWVFVCSYMYTYRCRCVYTYVDIYIDTYIHKYVYICTYTYLYRYIY